MLIICSYKKKIKIKNSFPLHTVYLNANSTNCSAFPGMEFFNGQIFILFKKKNIYMKYLKSQTLFFIHIFYFFTDLPNSSTTLTLDCQETVFLESGCEIVNRKCRCWGRKKICKNLSRIKWDFINLDVRFYFLDLLNKILTFCFICFIYRNVH